MVQYRFARRSDDSTVDAQLLARDDFGGDEVFRCLCCGDRLIAKVRGAERQPHFAHHPGTMCTPETYLHQLGKRVFADVYRECLTDGVPFEIELQHPRVCRKFHDWVGSACVLNENEIKTYDLTEYFDDLRIEIRDGEFVPDLLLFKKDKPEQRVYIEIAVTHFLSEKKASSNERIIEIPLDGEDDLAKITARTLTIESARFVNFTTETEMLTDSECLCADKTAFAFIVYRSGKCVLEESTLAGVASKHRRLQDSIAYFRIVQMTDRSGDGRQRSKSRIFQESVQEAVEEGFKLQNCYLCVYQADNFAGNKGFPVYCKCFRKACSSNEAVDCSAFKTDG